MNKIIEIDRHLSETLIGFREVSENLSFEVVGDLRNVELIGKHDYPGVYLIEIENTDKDTDFDTWLNDFRDSWEHPDYKKQFTPNIKKKRIEQHHNLKNWVPLYIGRSKNVSKRLLGHLDMELAQHTTAMKINARENMKLRNFRFSTIHIEVDNYDIIMPMIEKAQRDKINPILGRQ